MLKTNRDAILWLMGAEKELSACHQLKMSEAEIAERVWSWDTRVAFLKDENYACVDAISTGDELNIILSKAEVDLGECIELQELGIRKMTSDILIRAMRKRTPGAEALKRLISSLNTDALLEVAEKFPQAFNDLKPYEVLGLNSPEDAPVVVADKRWYLVSLLVKRIPKLAVDYMELLNNIPEGEMADMAKGIWDELFEIAMEKNFDMSQFIYRFYNEDKDKYVRLRCNIQTRSNKSKYIHSMFYGVVKKHYSKDIYPNVIMTSSQTFEGDEIEAYFWMNAALNNVTDTATFKTLFHEREFLAKVLSRVTYRHMLSMMYQSFFNSYQGVELLKTGADEEEVNVIRERLLVVSSAGELVKFFPFKSLNWTGKQVRKAIDLLVKAHVFPVERINELEVDEVEYAKEKLITHSQILVLSRKYDEQCRELIRKRNLTPEAECHLLDSDGLKYVKKLYIENYGLSMEGFKHLLGMKYNSYECKDDYLLLYAQKYGLTEEQWMLIAQSNMAGVASEFSCFVKK